MTNEFKYLGVTQSGKGVTGIVMAKSMGNAKQIVGDIAQKHDLRINSILPRKKFLYSVKLSNGQKIKGKQAAFTKEEVGNALIKIGYTNFSIQPVLLDFQFKPSFASILMFVNLSSFMLKEKMSYDRILRLLAEDESNPTLKETLKKIESELKKGKNGTEVFNRYGDIFGKFPAYMLGLATKSGNMSEVYDATAKFMTRDMEYRKSLKQALMSPMLTVAAMIGAVLYYLIKIFPATAKLFEKFGIELPVLTRNTLKLSDFLTANWILIVLALLIPIVGVLLWWRTDKGKLFRDKFIIGLPVIGHLLHKSSIEIFFRVFSAIYGGAENNIETLRASAEACRNKYIEKGVKDIAIPLMLKEGMSLVPALHRAGVFNKSTLSRLKTGSETGNVLQAAKQICSFYEQETTYKMQNVIQSIQTLISMFVSIVITALTVISAEIATIQPPPPGI